MANGRTGARAATGGWRAGAPARSSGRRSNRPCSSRRGHLQDVPRPGARGLRIASSQAPIRSPASGAIEQVGVRAVLVLDQLQDGHRDGRPAARVWSSSGRGPRPARLAGGPRETPLVVAAPGDSEPSPGRTRTTRTARGRCADAGRPSRPLRSSIASGGRRSPCQSHALPASSPRRAHRATPARHGALRCAHSAPAAEASRSPRIFQGETNADDYAKVELDSCTPSQSIGSRHPPRASVATRPRRGSRRV